MKRSIWYFVMIPALAAAAQAPSAPAPARQAPAPAQRAASGGVPSSVGPAKIAVIAFQVAVTNTNEFQRAFLELQRKYEPKRQSLHTQSDQIDALTKELQATDSKLTDAEKATKARELDTKKKQFDREQQDAQTDFSQEVQDLFGATSSKVYDVLASYAQQHGYTLVLDVAGQQSPVMYAPEAANITQDIVTAYNTKSGVPPPAAAPATGNAAPTAPKPGAGAAKPTAPKPQ